MDDGPETLAESLQMARLLAAVGFRQVHCTPHCVLGRFNNRPSLVQRATAELQEELSRAGIPLLLSPGMEYSLDENFPVLLEQPQCLGDSRLLLIEVPRQASPELVRDNVRLIIQRGLIPLMAHPERSVLLGWGEPFQKWPSITGFIRRWLACGSGPALSDAVAPNLLLQNELQDLGCLFQGNILGFSGRYGRKVQLRALVNLEQGLYSYFGSDGHGLDSLEAGLLPALQVLSEHQGGLKNLGLGADLTGVMAKNCNMESRTFL